MQRIPPWRTRGQKGEKMNWEHLLKVYEDMGVEEIIPIAHTRIHPHIKVLIDENGNYIGAMRNGKDRFTIPCTIESESRTSGNDPHPIHDNLQYLSEDYNEKSMRNTWSN